MTKRSDDTVEFFDPYGVRVDGELGFISPEFKIETGQLGKLLQMIQSPTEPYRVVYNRTVLQKQSKGIDTCGRWVALRIRMKQLALVDFVKLFQSGTLSPDEWATTMTLFV